MFQKFDVLARPEQGPPRVAKLRAELERHGINAFIVPRSDAHQGEYVAPRDERLAWLTGFTGSAGVAVVGAERAAVFVDGRYRVQVRAQIADLFEPVDWADTQVTDWVKAAMPDGILGFDPWLHTPRDVQMWETAGLQVRAIDNLVDAIWDDQPGPPLGRVIVQPDRLAGRSAAAKIAALCEEISAAGCAACILTLPDSISWLLNLRGADVAHNPVVHAFAVVHASGAVNLFSPTSKFAELTLPEPVDLQEPDQFMSVVGALTGKVWVDPASVPYAVWRVLEKRHDARDPCVLPKACKTPAELAGARAAHLRDAVAMSEFLSWFSETAPGDLTEIDVAQKLEMVRRETNQLRDISFETISAAGPNAALPHYRVSTQSNRPLAEGEVYLVDSGGQYRDGTTDITRTLAVGDQPDQVKRAFTRVLQGMIAMSRLKFPKGLSGADIDAVARVPLWAAGQDYAHGTGHGVGSYLSVHEGPQRLARAGREVLQPGMILSNEPGFYLEGGFGIRIENLIVVEEAPVGPEQSLDVLYQFETLTYVPIDRAMIDVDLLTRDERSWVDVYHTECLTRLASHVSDPSRLWLAAACAPL